MSATSDTLSDAITAITPLNSATATALGQLLTRITTYGTNLATLETGFSTTDPEDTENYEALQDLNQQLRDDAADIFGVLGTTLQVVGAPARMYRRRNDRT